MDLNRYQEQTQKTAIYPGQGTFEGLNYSIVAMVGEAGEVANEFKKFLRDDNGIMTLERREALLSEVGDTLWYLTRIAQELESTLALVAGDNIEKLNPVGTDSKSREPETTGEPMRGKCTCPLGCTNTVGIITRIFSSICVTCHLEGCLRGMKDP